MHNGNQTSTSGQDGREYIHHESSSDGGGRDNIIGFYDLTTNESSDDEVEQIIGFCDLTKTESSEEDNTMLASTSSGNNGVLRAITYDDSLAIISYIVQHKCTNNIFNDEMWIDMLKTRAWNHSWQTLRDHYIKTIRWDILTNSKKYPLSSSDIGILLQGFNNEQAARSSALDEIDDEPIMPELSVVNNYRPAIYRYSPSHYTESGTRYYGGMNNLPEPPVMPIMNTHNPMFPVPGSLYTPSQGNITLPDVMRWCANIHGGPWPVTPSTRQRTWHSPEPMPGFLEDPPENQPAPFTEQEDTDIVKHIVKYRRERNVLGNKLWKHMEKAGLHENRTWRALRDRYLHHIRLDILYHPTKYPFLTALQIENLKHGFNSVSSGPDFSDTDDDDPEIVEPPPVDPTIDTSEDWSDTSYTAIEDMAIINYIIQKRCINNLLGNKVWKEMQKTHVGNRTWQSLRSRFTYRIKTNIMAGARRYPCLGPAELDFFRKIFHHN